MNDQSFYSELVGPPGSLYSWDCCIQGVAQNEHYCSVAKLMYMLGWVLVFTGLLYLYMLLCIQFDVFVGLLYSMGLYATEFIISDSTLIQLLHSYAALLPSVAYSDKSFPGCIIVQHIHYSER